jgi:hypothetical protein
MNIGRVMGSVSLTVGTALFGVMIAVIIAQVNGAEAAITAVSPVLWLIVNPPVLLTLLGAIALSLSGLTIYSWLAGALQSSRRS